MAQQSSREQHHPAERLASRHIFLDTQVYRALNHDPANRALALLKEQVNSHRVVLHTTDITLLEVRRQIRERVLARQRELMLIERDLNRWRKSAPKAAPEEQSSSTPKPCPTSYSSNSNGSCATNAKLWSTKPLQSRLELSSEPTSIENRPSTDRTVRSSPTPS